MRFVSTVKAPTISRLTALELENFMSIEKARLEFDETGILNLCGYNDSGKSAITRALEVVFYNAYSNDQVNFIQDGKSHFGIGLEFSDGVEINRYKYIDGKSVWEMYKNGNVVFSNRLEDGIAALSDIPDVIRKYLGVIEDEITGEKLNVRRNTDRLFLINTTGGDNYKIINTVLRADILAESVNRLNKDRNTLQSELAALSTSSQTLKNELTHLVVLGDDLVAQVKENAENLADTKKRFEYLYSIQSQKAILDAFVVYDELPLIDTDQFRDIENLLELRKALDIPIYDACPLIDVSRLQLLEEIIQLRKSLDVDIPPALPTIDVSRFNEIMEIGRLYNSYLETTNSLNQVSAEYEQVRGELESLSKQYGFKICKNCGAVAV